MIEPYLLEIPVNLTSKWKKNDQNVPVNFIIYSDFYCFNKRLQGLLSSKTKTNDSDERSKAEKKTGNMFHQNQMQMATWKNLI